MKKIYLFGFIFLFGCSSTPTWTNANVKQRQIGIFIPDDNYYNSEQYKQDIEESAQIISDLKSRLGKEYFWQQLSLGEK